MLALYILGVALIALGISLGNVGVYKWDIAAVLLGYIVLTINSAFMSHWIVLGLLLVGVVLIYIFLKNMVVG